ncbi:MAG: preprotein translocase subunit SecG [Alphaproteobacteria bacterium]|nr:MAG: preprotein translocase subunit SecG [Alphaproteobacteria bacterium]
MYNFLLTVHILSILLMIGMILLQKSESGGLVSSSGMGGLMSARGSANFFTRTTATLAVIFFTTALILAMISGRGGSKVSSLLDSDPLALKNIDVPVNHADNVQAPPAPAPAESLPKTPKKKVHPKKVTAAPTEKK